MIYESCAPPRARDLPGSYVSGDSDSESTATGNLNQSPRVRLWPPNPSRFRIPIHDRRKNTNCRVLLWAEKGCEGPARGRPFTLLMSLLFRPLRPGRLMLRSRSRGGRVPDHCRHVGDGIGAIAQAGRGLARTGVLGRLGTSTARTTSSRTRAVVGSGAPRIGCFCAPCGAGCRAAEAAARGKPRRVV
jgi:hypothetical protein